MQNIGIKNGCTIVATTGGQRERKNIRYRNHSEVLPWIRHSELHRVLRHKKKYEKKSKLHKAATEKRRKSALKGHKLKLRIFDRETDKTETTNLVLECQIQTS
jgi:hypothetical protein